MPLSVRFHMRETRWDLVVLISGGILWLAGTLLALWASSEVEETMNGQGGDPTFSLDLLEVLSIVGLVLVVAGIVLVIVGAVMGTRRDQRRRERYWSLSRRLATRRTGRKLERPKRAAPDLPGEGLSTQACPRCGADNPAFADYCTACSARLGGRLR
jgi:hypothetical protein